MLEDIMFSVPRGTEKKVVEDFLEQFEYSIQENEHIKLPKKMGAYDLYYVQGPQERYTDFNKAVKDEKGYTIWPNAPLWPE